MNMSSAIYRLQWRGTSFVSFPLLVAGVMRRNFQLLACCVAGIDPMSGLSGLS